MKLEEAINLNSATMYELQYRLDPEQKAALLLGIEALKRLEEGRSLGVVAMMHLLPRETKD